MQTFLIVSLNKSFIDKELDKIKKKLNVSSFNFHEILSSPSIGIEEVRKLQKILTLKPYGGGERLIVIKEAEKATIEAQNALLKILEEPPFFTSIILISGGINKLLTTVISRCQIITEKNIPPVQVDFQKTEELLKTILKSSAGKRILLSQNSVTTKEDAVLLLNSLLSVLENLLFTPSNIIQLSLAKTVSLIVKVEAAKKYLEKNVSYKTTLDILFLGFPSLEK